MSGKGRENRRHAERPFSSQDFFLQRFMLFKETLGQWTAPTIEVAHPEPIEIEKFLFQKTPFLIIVLAD